MANNIKQFRNRSYLAKDFDSLRTNLLQYARLYYPDKIQDFSESSLGGLFLDMAAYTGDVMSFYLDHQYNELDPDTAIETSNIERLIRSAGVPIVGAAPATATVTVYIEVPAATIDGNTVPIPSSLPVIKANSIFSSFSNINFTLLEDIDFSKKNADGSYAANIKVGRLNANNKSVATLTMSLDGICISGNQETEVFSIGEFVPFRTITLSQNNITDILSVTDSFGNSYYEVSTLTDDVVYKNVLNTAHDSNDISDSLKVVPAPYRFIKSVDLANRQTSIILGGGNDENIEDDAVPDPSEFAISFPYSKTFSRTSINPLKLLNTRTLGIYSTNSRLSITYRYGGGLNHNVPANSINVINELIVQFPLNPSLETMNAVRSSMAVTNKSRASGGEDAPTTDQLKLLIPSSRNSQERIVTKEDLLARVYSLPANFGRVFRAAVRPNPNNPLSTQLHIITRTPNSKLAKAPDTLKENIRKYLAPYRLITDAIDILDAQIVNLSFQFDIVVDPALNKQLVLQSILSRLIQEFDITKFSIDQPIVLSDIQNIIFSTQGVISVVKIEFKNLSGVINGRTYSDVSFDVKNYTRKGMIYPPEGGIFEFRFPDFDIIGRTAL
jgi:hypothetical protein